MKTLSPKAKMDMDFPSKNYTKYRSQSKTNPFLNKLSQDAGYPQDILKTHETISVRSHKNYLQMNKQGLKNFFSDRLPVKDVEIYRESFTLEPSRLFQIKKRQHELKTLTRSKLEEKLDSSVVSSKLDPNKFTEIFEFNDKNQDFKKKFLSNESLRIAQPYERDNFLKGTTSYVQKYSKIVKKVAYNSVFGPETSAVPRKSSTARLGRQDTTFTRPFTTIEQRKKSNTASTSKQFQRKKFSSLIQKIDSHRQSLDPQNKRGMKPYIPPPQAQDNEQNKSQMITWIRDTAKQYKYNSINVNAHQLRELQDMEKVDNKFYQDMKLHKAKRLGHRESYVQKVVVKSGSRGGMAGNRTTREKQDGEDKSDHSLSDISGDRHSSKYSISSSEESEVEVPKHRFTPVMLLKKFIRLLVDALQQARYFGIESKTNIYKAFWQNSDPYEKSGSYAFFKAIKKGQLSGVQKFIAADYDYLYERDYKGRSPLICATLNNHDPIIDYLMKCDINVNKMCFNHKTALYYAIKNGNVGAVKKLLQAGALPWSSKKCGYGKMQEKVGNQKINNLLKNARKIAIIVQLQPTKPQKIATWKRLKHKIIQHELITF